MERNLKLVLYIIVTIFALGGGAWGFNKVFATNERVDKLEIRVNGVSLRYLRKQLTELKNKYGHTNCEQMQSGDAELCFWLKDTIQSLGGGYAG